ncbi:MAG: hypothetical protein KDD61_00340 [Bdellovibrionales bacterium]|nr:hypothetical protein [Bdellovibrionales bacterium]
MIVRWISIVTLSIAFASLSFAVDVNPRDDLGQIRVELPKLNPSDLGVKDFKPEKVHLIYEIAGKRTQLAVGKTYDVAAGQGCLSVSYSQQVSSNFKNCKVTIYKKQKTEILLSAIALDWDRDQLEVHVGPQASFNLIDEDSTYHLTIPPNYKEVPFFIVPAGKFSVKFNSRIMVLADQQQSQMITPGRYLNWNVTPQDRRRTIMLNFEDHPKKFSAIDGNHVFVLERNVQTENWSRDSYFPYGNDVARRLLPGNSGFGEYGVTTWYMADPVKKGTMIKAFPLGSKSEAVYEIVVNNIPHKVGTLENTNVFTFNVVTLNVHNFIDKSRQGTFKVFQKGAVYRGGVDHKTGMRQVKKPDYYSGRLFDSYFYTESSLDLPRGFVYVLDFYLDDDLGRKTRQESIEVDLR